MYEGALSYVLSKAEATKYGGQVGAPMVHSKGRKWKSLSKLRSSISSSMAQLRLVIDEHHRAKGRCSTAPRFATMWLAIPEAGRNFPDTTHSLI